VFVCQGVKVSAMGLRLTLLVGQHNGLELLDLFLQDRKDGGITSALYSKHSATPGTMHTYLCLGKQGSELADAQVLVQRDLVLDLPRTLTEAANSIRTNAHIKSDGHSDWSCSGVAMECTKG
jgi:hypothetical protein